MFAGADSGSIGKTMSFLAPRPRERHRRGGGFFQARSVRQPRRASCDCRSRTFARASEQRRARGKSKELKIKLCAVLQLPWGNVAGSDDRVETLTVANILIRQPPSRMIE